MATKKTAIKKPKGTPAAEKMKQDYGKPTTSWSVKPTKKTPKNPYAQTNKANG